MPSASIHPKIPQDFHEEVEDRWQKALAYYKSRGSVVFLSYCRFWERHGFVQQSLANVLSDNGIEVIWFDGSGWRSYEPFLYFTSPRIHVQSLFALPLQRLSWVKHVSLDMQAQKLRRLLRGKKNAILWVQAGIDEALAGKLPYIDIYSTFDDPYRHQPGHALCEKARNIICQNAYSHRLMSQSYPRKSVLALPPVDIKPEIFESVLALSMPASFPKKVMGYIGSFFSHDYDLVMFETFVRTMPDWGFVLMGRTDAEGNATLERLRLAPNFIYIPWMPRSQTASAWRLLDVSLLLYRPSPSQAGAFPVKVLESLYFGVPCVATQVPKTEDLGRFFPRSSFIDELKALAEVEARKDSAALLPAYLHFSWEMNPKLHLTKAVEHLMTQESFYPNTFLASNKFLEASVSIVETRSK